MGQKKGITHQLKLESLRRVLMTTLNLLLHEQNNNKPFLSHNILHSDASRYATLRFQFHLTTTFNHTWSPMVMRLHRIKHLNLNFFENWFPHSRLGELEYHLWPATKASNNRFTSAPTWGSVDSLECNNIITVVGGVVNAPSKVNTTFYLFVDNNPQFRQ